MATAHDKYVPHPKFLWISLTVSQICWPDVGGVGFCGYRYAILDTPRFTCVKCILGIWLYAKEANLVDSRVELCHHKKGPYHNPTKRSERC